MLRDRGDQLKYALVSALARAAKVVRGLRIGLTVGEREAVAEAAVDQLRKAPADPGNSPNQFRAISASCPTWGRRLSPIGASRSRIRNNGDGHECRVCGTPKLCHLYERDILGG